MSTQDHDEKKAHSSRLPAAVAFGVLFVFWVAIAVCVAAIAIDSAWDARDDGAAAAAPTATVAAEPTPVATPEPRPPGVPMTAAPVDGEFDTGEPQVHLFFNLACADGLLTVVTTDELVFAETACPTAIEPVFLEPFLTDPVRIAVANGQLDIVSVEGERLTFPIGRAWIERR